jgi:photosystem II stability/assembly factor-like uncharacterized protein
MAVTRAGKRLVSVGEHGVVALSDDDGKHWRQASDVPVDVTLTNVRFASDQVGWAVGHFGVILRTDDGGEHWVVQLDGQTAAKLMYAAAKMLDSEDSQTVLAAQHLIQDGPDKPWLDLLVASEHKIIVVGAFNLALQSLDGGKTWQAIATGTANASNFHLYGVARSENELLLAGEQGMLLKQTAGTDYFKVLESPYEGSFFGALALGSDRFLVYGLRGYAFLTQDGGDSWVRVAQRGTDATFNAATLLDRDSVALADQAGRVFVSRDGGEHFTTILNGGAPVTGLTPTAEGGLAVSTLGGMLVLPPSIVNASK